MSNISQGNNSSHANSIKSSEDKNLEEEKQRNETLVLKGNLDDSKKTFDDVDQCQIKQDG